MIVVLVMKLILLMRMMIEIVIVIVMAMLIMTRVKMIIMILIIIIITKTMMHPIRNVRFHVILRCYYMYSYVFRCSCCHDILLVFVCSELSFIGHCDHVN